MDLDDVPGEAGLGVVAAAVTALLLSPRVRRLIRRGAVAGLAGALTAGDAVAAWTRRVASAAGQDDTTSTAFAEQLAREARDELSRQASPNGEL